MTAATLHYKLKQCTFVMKLCAWSCALAVLPIAIGCRNPYAPPNPNWQAYNPALSVPGMPGAAPPGALQSGVFAQGMPQVVELQRRVQQLDDNNRQLTTQLAQAQQQSQAFRERADLLSAQLQDATNQNRQLLTASQQYADQARGLQASMTARGGARLTANNSVANLANGLQIGNARVIPEGDLIRIRLAADQLFAPGSAQMNPAASNTLDQVASAIMQRFPRQRVGIEGHTDTMQVSSSAGTPYQLSGSQAQAVMDQLVRKNGVPMQQLFVIAHGPNHPIADNQTPAGRSENRRIDIVVYPETF